ncbi:Hsp70 family protein [Clostridium sp.]|uniref:Hsp70 family protein n=1 Tax=Clostridium sp. TaxID=1506 RepID=UPI003D6D9640
MIINYDSCSDKSIVKMKVTDVNSHSLGVLANDSESNKNYNNIILPRNTPLPAENYSDFYSMYDNQEFVDLEVTEGEDEDPEYIKIIGTTRLYLKKRVAGSPIRVVMSYDENSVIHVHVIDLIDNDDLGEMRIERIANLSEDDVNKKANKISKLKIE